MNKAYFCKAYKNITLHHEDMHKWISLHFQALQTLTNQMNIIYYFVFLGLYQ